MTVSDRIGTSLVVALATALGLYATALVGFAALADFGAFGDSHQLGYAFAYSALTCVVPATAAMLAVRTRHADHQARRGLAVAGPTCAVSAAMLAVLVLASAGT